MIKARGSSRDGTALLVLGLSFANLDRLRAGDSITFNATDYGFHGLIHIFAGRDEQVMMTMVVTDSPHVVIRHDPEGP